jgi:phage-related holin
MKSDFYGLVLKFIGVLLVVTLPIRPALIAVSLLVLIDFLTGIAASYKEGRRITSGGFRRTVVKTLVYQTAILVAFMIETWLLEGVAVVKVITGLIAITEGKSFFENIYRLTGINFWNEIISKLNMPDNSAKPPSDKQE